MVASAVQSFSCFQIPIGLGREIDKIMTLVNFATKMIVDEPMALVHQISAEQFGRCSRCVLLFLIVLE